MPTKRVPMRKIREVLRLKFQAALTDFTPRGTSRPLLQGKHLRL